MAYHHDDRSNLGRIGIIMYGIDPAGNETKEFKQVMSLYSKVALIKKIKAGDRVGYGLTYTADEDEYLATIPIGYADGLIRKNQGRNVYINGKYFEIVVVVIGNNSDNTTLSYQQTMTTFVEKNRSKSLYYVDVSGDSDYTTWLEEKLDITDGTVPQTLVYEKGKVKTAKTGALSYYRLSQLYK